MDYPKRSPRKKAPLKVKYLRIDAKTVIEVDASIPDDVAIDRYLQNQKYLNKS